MDFAFLAKFANPSTQDQLVKQWNDFLKLQRAQLEELKAMRALLERIASRVPADP